MAGPVGVDELPGHDRVGRVGGHRGEGLAEFGAQFLQRGAVAGDPDDVRAGLASAVAMPRPKPRLAPVTSAAAPVMSFSGITILPGYCGFPRRSFGGLLIGQVL